MENFDLIILGGGPGGYVSAIRAAQLGLKVAIVEKNSLGGTCLHAGCIPTKAFLKSAEVFRLAKNATSYGVNTQNASFDFAKVLERKNNLVETLKLGIERLMKKWQISVFVGYGKISRETHDNDFVQIEVRCPNEEKIEVISGKNCIIATGAKPKTLAGLEIDGTQIVTSDHAVMWEKLPKSVLIVGGGVIGMEWASLLADFGVEIVVLEYSSRCVPTEDEDISKELQRLMKKRGIKIVTNANLLIETLVKNDAGIALNVEVRGKVTEYRAEKMLVSVGRNANIKGFGLSNTDVLIENGFIKTDDFYKTDDPKFYAIGDVAGRLQLAHVASREGVIAVEHLCGKSPKKLEEKFVPKCIYTRHECAQVGLSEGEARAFGYTVKTGKVHFRAIGKALVNGDVDGFVKFVIDQMSYELLGVHIIGGHATELIMEPSLALIFSATAKDIVSAVHPHPSLTEAIYETALAVNDLALHQ